MRRGWWPEIIDPKSAGAAAKAGAMGAFLCVGATVLMVLLKQAPMSAYLDAGIFLILGLMILRMSRVAAVTALVFFVLERFYASFAHGLSAAIGAVAIVVLLAFLNGVRGTFAYHRMRTQDAVNASRGPEAGV
jgi:hypothetical protein